MPNAEKSAAVVAAGALIWRDHQGRLELLIIHRPKYDDWSWPKGKQDRGETIPETAVREVAEEVGLGITLGAPLAVTTYKIKQGRKDVHYWAAQLPAGKRPKADGGEVDELAWVSVKKARRLLTNESDVEPLDQLVELYEAGDLQTRQVIVVRHAKAKPRSSWNRAEGDRPLAATGKRQAMGVWRVLACWRPQKVISSPWVRCMQTVAGYAQRFDLPVKEKNRLTEAEHERKPKRVAKLIHSLFEGRSSVVVCTHRPVLPTVLTALAEHAPSSLARTLPQRDPYLVPGEIIVVNQSVRNRSHIVSIEQFRPLDD